MMAITPDAKFYDYNTGVATKLIPMADGSGATPAASYAPAVVSFQPLSPGDYDYISCSYTGSNLTQVVYKLGGAGGTTVATLTLTYDGSNNLLTVTRS